MSGEPLAKTFETTVTVEFNHCDPAGMVFYPRYFELINHTIETWFAHIGWDYHTMHMERREGIPLVKVEAEFTAASRLGDRLRFCAYLERLGSRSMTVRQDAWCADEHRLTVRQVLVYCRTTGSETTSIDIPGVLRERITQYLHTAESPA